MRREKPHKHLRLVPPLKDTSEGPCGTTPRQLSEEELDAQMRIFARNYRDAMDRRYDAMTRGPNLQNTECARVGRVGVRVAHGRKSSCLDRFCRFLVKVGERLGLTEVDR